MKKKMRMRMIERRCGAMAKIMPASSAPTTERTPHVTTMASHTMPTSALNELAAARCRRRWRRAPPPSPATNALDAEQHELHLHDAHAAGERGRLARADGGEHQARRRAFQVHDQRRPTTAKTTATIAYISSRSVMPIPNGRGDWHAGAEVLVLVARPHELLDEEREADGEQREVEVADPQAGQRHQQPERHREHARRPGSPATTGHPASAASRAAANAPMPASVIWQSEIMPPSPVTSV